MYGSERTLMWYLSVHKAEEEKKNTKKTCDKTHTLKLSRCSIEGTFPTWIGSFCKMQTKKKFNGKWHNLRLTNWLLFDLMKCTLYAMRFKIQVQNINSFFFLLFGMLSSVRAKELVCPCQFEQNFPNIFNNKIAEHKNDANFKRLVFRATCHKCWGWEFFRVAPVRRGKTLPQIQPRIWIKSVAHKLVYGELIDMHASKNWWSNIPLR